MEEKKRSSKWKRVLIITIVVCILLLFIIFLLCRHMHKTVTIESVYWHREMVVEKVTESGEIKTVHCITYENDSNPYWADWLLLGEVDVVSKEETYTVTCKDDLGDIFSFSTDCENFLKLELGSTVKIARNKLFSDEVHVIFD